jgi:putative ABC transport system permease protein
VHRGRVSLRDLVGATWLTEEANKVDVLVGDPPRRRFSDVAGRASLRAAACAVLTLSLRPWRAPTASNAAGARPEVAVASPIRLGHWLDKGTADALTAVDLETLPHVTDLRMTAGSLAALRSGGVVLADSVANERHLRVGDAMPMTFPRGAQRLRVAGLMSDQSAQALSTNYVISLEEYQRHYSEHVDAALYVALANGVSEAEGQHAVKAAVAGFPNAEVLDQRQAADRRAASVDQVLGLITLLLAFAVLIALLGITNTLALSIVERTREIGLLRAVGMTRSQLSAMVRAEAILIAAVAVAVGVTLGVGLAAETMAGIATDVPFMLRVPVVQLLAVVAAAVLAGLIAGLVPARRAARLDVLSAIASQRLQSDRRPGSGREPFPARDRRKEAPDERITHRSQSRRI